MNKLRIKAKDAKNLYEKAKEEIAHKNLILKSNQNKLKGVFQNIFDTAISGEVFFEYSDEDAVFLNFFYKEFKKLDFYIEIYGSNPDLDIEEIRCQITDLEYEIEEIGEQTIASIETLAQKLNEFILPHPEYIQVYEWLIDAYEERPLIEKNWYDSHYKKLPIVRYAGHDGLFISSNIKFEWQEKLKKIIFEIKRIHESASLKIQDLRKKISPLEDLAFNNNKFRILDSEQDIDLIEIYSIKIYWDEEKIKDHSNLNEISFFSPYTLYWLSSESGQQFLDYIEGKIKFSSENGKDEILLRFFKDEDETFYLEFEGIEISALPPDIAIEFYLTMGFQAKKFKAKNISKNDSESDFIDIKISWQ